MGRYQAGVMMQQQQPSLGRRIGTASIVLAIITACANGGDADIDGGGDGAMPKKDSGNQVQDTGGQKDTNMNMCGTCNIDLDCQNTCGAPPDGMTWCCDTSSSSCYPSSQCSGGWDGGGGNG